MLALPVRPDLLQLPRHAAETLLVLADWTVLVIDFRYHLVSIVAVFLALAIGIVIGATALQAPRGAAAASTKASPARAAADQLQQRRSEQQISARPGVRPGRRAAAARQPARRPEGGARHRAGRGRPGDHRRHRRPASRPGAKVTGQAELQPAFFDTSASTEQQPRSPGPAGRPPAPAYLPTDAAGPAQIAGQQEAAQVHRGRAGQPRTAPTCPRPEPGDPRRVRPAGIPAAQHPRAGATTLARPRWPS